jgi:hypothetical protein
MTDYFDALIRASGLAVGQPPAAGGSHATGVDPDVTRVMATELDELAREHVAPPVDHTAAPIAATEPSPAPAAAVSSREQNRNEPVASTARVVVPRATDDGMERKPQTSPTPPAAPTDAAPSPPPHGSAASSDHAALVSSQERIVRAALEWVAADPVRLTVPSAAATASPAASPPSARARAPLPAPPRTPADSRSDPDASSTPQIRPAVEQAKPAPPLTPGEPPSMPVTPRARVPIEPAVAIERAALRSLADRRPLQQDEVVEVSIGAIHVHVDAPAPPTAAPAPPAPRTPLSASRPARDGLRRRALRRI